MGRAMTDSPQIQESSSYEWVTTLVIRHHAGSNEGAIFQRREWDQAIEATGAEVVMGGTRPGHAGSEAMDQLQRFLGADEDDK